MIQEHALTYQDKLTISHLDYLVSKANRLGKSGRDVMRVFEEIDKEGIHIYFSVTGMHNGQGRVSQEIQS